jgi:PKD domain-containing protein
MTGGMLGRIRTARAAACLGVGLTLAMGGCGLDNVDVPDLDGPSTFGQALSLSVSPDVVTADGFSSALVSAELRDQDGREVSGKDVFFAIADESGRFADIGTLFDLNGNQLGAPEAIIRTNSSGVARVVYRTPPRTDATANQSILISARPVGTDFNGAFYRTVRLELRSAEPLSFPQVPSCLDPAAPPKPFCNDAPACAFVVEAPDGFRAGRTILFQSTGGDVDGTIIRFEWFFGDGTGPDYFPQTVHVFAFPGSYTVTLKVTDDDGGQKACSTSVTVN